MQCNSAYAMPAWPVATVASPVGPLSRSLLLLLLRHCPGSPSPSLCLCLSVCLPMALNVCRWILRHSSSEARPRGTRDDGSLSPLFTSIVARQAIRLHARIMRTVRSEDGGRLPPLSSSLLPPFFSSGAALFSLSDLSVTQFERNTCLSVPRLATIYLCRATRT